MAITRYDINGSLTALKAALEALGDGWFSSIELDNDETPTTLTCKDEDGNTILEWYKSSNQYGAKAFKDSTHFHGSAATSSNTYNPQYLYKVGNNGAVIKANTLANLYIIAKTNDGRIAITIPNSGTSSVNSLFATCWGDDIALTDSITITGSSGSGTGVGNHTLLVPIPLHGTYEENLYIPKAFFMPAVQPNMRGVVQELTGESGTYLTNGYVALLDD